MSTAGVFGAYEMQVASIMTLGVVAAASIPSAFSLIGNRRIGKPNGRGNVVEMVGKALDEAETAKALAAEAVQTVEDNHICTERRLDEQDRSLERIELSLRAALIDRGITGEDDHA